MCSIKDVSSNLKLFLPKSEREFLDSRYKTRLIFTYRAAKELMKENEIVQHFKLNNLGVCYDFVANYISSPRCNMNSLDDIYYIFNNFERDGRFAISQSALYESFWEPFEGVRNFTDNLGNELQNEEKQFGSKR